MSHSQFHCTGRVYLDLHGLIFETSICYWQDQPGSPPVVWGAERWRWGRGRAARPTDRQTAGAARRGPARPGPQPLRSGVVRVGGSAVRGGEPPKPGQKEALDVGGSPAAGLFSSLLFPFFLSSRETVFVFFPCCRRPAA